MNASKRTLNMPSTFANAIANGRYDPAMKAKMEELRSSKSQYEIRIAKIKAQISIHELSCEQIHNFLKKYQNIKQLAKPQQKKAIILFVNKVVVNEESIDIHVLTAFTKENSASKNADTVSLIGLRGRTLMCHWYKIDADCGMGKKQNALPSVCTRFVPGFKLVAGKEGIEIRKKERACRRH